MSALDQTRRIKLIPSDFFVFRTPLLPYQEFLDWTEGMTAPAAVDDPVKLKEALARDRGRLRAHLRGFIDRPEIREALHIASPSFEQSLRLWMEEPDSEKGQSAEESLVRYFVRAVSRCTPFGLFAGYSIGTIGEQTNLALVGRPEYERHSRLAMYYLITVAEAIAKDPALKDELRFRPNPSIYTAAGRLRYVETRVTEDGQTFHLVAVESTEFLDLALRLAGQGALPAAIAGGIVERDPEISVEEARAYVEELIQSGLLVPDLGPALTGREAIHGLLDQLRGYPHLAAVLDRLAEAQRLIEAMDADGLGNPPERYRAIAERLSGLPAKLDSKELYQVNLIKPAPNATLGRQVVDEVIRGIELLYDLAAPPGDDPFSRFRRDFETRYGDREVPLVEALDEETGIGFDAATTPAAYPSPLLEGLAFPIDREDSVTLRAREIALMTLVEQALIRGENEIRLETDLIDRLRRKDKVGPPDAFTVMVKIAASSEDALEGGDYRLLLGDVCGPSGAELFGRFTQGDPRLSRLVHDHVQHEQALRPDAIFAEVVHAPEGRTANVVSRSALHTHEIPFLGRGGATDDQSLPVTDLLVSVSEGRIVLRSRRLEREVIPRLSNAHNFSASRQGIYRFLCWLQHQDSQSVSHMLWGALDRLPYLPRLVHGRFVLSRAQWRVNHDELASVQKLEDGEGFRAVQTWRTQRRLPRIVVVVELDHELLVDFDNVLSVGSFLELLKSRGHLVVAEMLPGPDQLAVHGPEGRFVSEIIVPLRQVREHPPMQEARGRFAPGSLPRRFSPGSGWLYGKLYTGTATADQLLRGPIQDLVAKAIGSGLVDQWFFIRYQDPEFHLRVRFHGSAESMIQGLLPIFHETSESLLKDGRVWRVDLGTYDREIVRYGGPEGMLLAERLFREDSDATIKLMHPAVANPTGDARWLLTLLGIDLLLEGAGCEVGAKLALMKRLREGFAAELKVDKPLTVLLGRKYRDTSGAIAALLDRKIGENDVLAFGLDVLRERSDRLAPVLDELQSLVRHRRLSVSPEDWMTSVIHLHVNRMLQAAHRAQELVLYDLLTRHYESQIGRARQAQARRAERVGV